MTDETSDRLERIRRANRRTALIVGLIALAGFVYTIVRGIIK